MIWLTALSDSWNGAPDFQHSSQKQWKSVVLLSESSSTSEILLRRAIVCRCCSFIAGQIVAVVQATKDLLAVLELVLEKFGVFVSRQQSFGVQYRHFFAAVWHWTHDERRLLANNFLDMVEAQAMVAVIKEGATSPLAHRTVDSLANDSVGTLNTIDSLWSSGTVIVDWNWFAILRSDFLCLWIIQRQVYDVVENIRFLIHDTLTIATSQKWTFHGSR